MPPKIAGIMSTISSDRTRRMQAFTSLTGKSPQLRRVLQVITPSHMSGAETQLVRLTRHMRDRGHYMPVVVKHGSSAVPEMFKRGFDVETARIGGKINALAIPMIASAAKRHKAQLTQSNLSTASWWCGWLEALGGPKSIGHVHGFTSARWHRHQSHLLAVSGAVKDDMIEQGIPAEKITVLWNALDADEFRPQRDSLAVRSDFGADANTPVIGTFGHLSIKKGHRELFAAMPTVVKRFPNVQFWIIGQGDLKDELEATARAGGFLDNVRLAGYRRDAADVMNALDVFCLPSHREPCALVYVEAALLGKPIVACRAGGAPESIADGETGLLVPPKESAGLAEALLSLLENRDVARRMGQAGHDRACDLFTWSKYIATLEGVYDRVLG
jgi:glycosyltransferase involved in cell wall biosynthesis